MGTLLNQVTDKPKIKPPRIVIHGKPGVGKTSFAADAEGVLFMPLEEGLATLEVPHLAKPETYANVMSALWELRTEQHDYRVLALDTIDKMEPLVWQAVCEEGGKTNIEDFGFGKGYTKADYCWQEFFEALNDLVDRGMTIIVLCHNEGRMIDDPQIGAYNHFTPKLHKRANALLTEWADIIGYLDTERVAVDKGDKRETRTSQSTGQRVLHLEDQGAFVAKNRYDLPPMIQIPKERPYQALRNELINAIALATETETA
jgi:hypothetical protein